MAASGHAVHIDKKDTTIWVTIPDAINMDNYQVVETSITAELISPIDTVIIDFEQTKTMFSAGFGLLVRLKKRVDGLGGTLHLINIPERVLDGLSAVGLTRLLTIHESAEAYYKATNANTSG